MKLKEDKSLIIIEIIALVFIIMSSIGIQMCDSRIDIYETSILFDLVNSSRKESERINQQVKSLKYLFSAYANAKVTAEELSETNRIKYPEAANIIDRFRKGKISSKEYCNKLSNFFNRQEGTISKEYNGILINLEVKLRNKPIYYEIKGILVVLQILAIVISVCLYIFILKSINKRIA